ncbi:MAG TPA: ABC transporter substrate-binding protein [Polyangia bacterium]
MSRTQVANAGALLFAIALALFLGYDRGPRAPMTVTPTGTTVTSVRRVPLPKGGYGVADASGHLVPLRRYERIISTNLVSDHLLLELAEPSRILAVSRISALQSPWRWRFAGKPTVDGMGPLETIIALKPDLVLMNVFGGEGRADKLRAAGIAVFNLGELRGLSTFLPTAEVVGELLGAPGRARGFVEKFQQRFERVDAGLGSRPRRRAIYVAVIAGSIIGGTRGTSYHDVLTHAGLVDAAAATYTDWPKYRPEQIAALDTELIVTKDGMAEAVCSHPGLETLPVCERPGHVLTLPEGLLEEPGMAMLDAAELLFAKAYPELSAAASRPPARP